MNVAVGSEEREGEKGKRTHLVIKFRLWMLDAQLIHQHTLILSNNAYGYFPCKLNDFNLGIVATVPRKDLAVYATIRIGPPPHVQ